jgi:type I restriction enzyme S subunit
MNIRQAQLPKGWEIKKLAEVSDLMNGYAFQSKHYTDEGYFVIRIGNVQDGIIELNNARYIQLNEEKQKKFILQSGDILISLTGNVGRVGVINEAHLPAVLNQRVAKISIKKETKLNKDFIFNFLTSEYFISELIKAGRGAAQQNISTTDIENLEIPIPHLSEQQSIVATLDEAFTAIAKAKANAEQNLKNSKELFESYLQGIFEKGNWDTKTIAEVCDEIFAGGDAPKNNFSLEENEKYKIPIYANAVKYRGLYGYTDAARVTKPSITISARGSGTGHTEIRFDKYLPIVRLIVLIPNLSLINLEFLKHSIDNLDILRSGSAIPQLTVPMIKEYNLPLPSLEQQKIIVQKLTILQNETQKLEEIYNQKINDLEELKKSVLQKAFSGELKTAKALV